MRVLAAVAAVILFVLSMEYHWWSRRAARCVVPLGVFLVPDRQRELRREEWLGELDNDDAAGLMFAANLLAAGIRLRLSDTLPRPQMRLRDVLRGNWRLAPPLEPTYTVTVAPPGIRSVSITAGKPVQKVRVEAASANAAAPTGTDGRGVLRSTVSAAFGPSLMPRETARQRSQRSNSGPRG